VAGAFIYNFGISAAWFFIGKIFGYSIFALLLERLKDRIHMKSYTTLADYFRDFYGRKIAKFIGVLVVFIYIGWTLVGFVGGAQIIQYLSGWSYQISLITILAFVFSYMIIGGFRNVVRTDFVQWVALFIIFLLFLLRLGDHWNALEPWQWNVFEMGPANIMAFFLAGLLFPFSAMELWQRVYALKEKHKFLSMMTFFGVMYLAFGIILCLVIMLIRVLEPGLDPNMALVQGIVNIFPPTFVALGTVAFFAAIIASVIGILLGEGQRKLFTQ